MNGIMRYFTKELWLGYNDQGPLDFKTASEQGERNLREYAEQLEQLRPRLSRQAYRFFKNENLHDGRLLAFMAGDALEHDVHGAKRFNINAHNPSVVMKVLGQDLDVLYSLKYTKVRKVGFEFPSALRRVIRNSDHHDRALRCAHIGSERLAAQGFVSRTSTLAWPRAIADRGLAQPGRTAARHRSR
jgi:hypothetical protein